MQITNDTIIEIVQGENVGHQCTLSLFLDENDLDPETVSNLRFDLATTGQFTDGGGAAPVWTIRVVNEGIVADYHKALENVARFEQAGDTVRAEVANGLAKAIWSVMTTAEKWESIPNAVR